MATAPEIEAPAGRFGARCRRFGPDLRNALSALYDAATTRELEKAILTLAKRAYGARSEELKALDCAREGEAADWFQRPEMLGYMCYPERFAGCFAGVRAKIPYLKGLGVTYLHLLSVLKARAGDSDGGFAIADYQATNERLGSIEDLERLATDFRRAGISLCLDFVFNHTAREHEWARRARMGEKAYQDFYFMYPDRQTPDRYEPFLAQVFPATAPGNFSYEAECGKWVWTTFFPYQWDLNYHNPAVLFAMLENLLALANRGVEVFRLDAAIYAWKEEGTACRNLPQTHALLQVFRAALQVVAPGVVLKAEAVAGAREIAEYFGSTQSEGKECQLAYHTAAMAALWDCLATQDVRRASALLAGLPKKPPGTSWVYYVRCHDDIGWGALQDSQGADWSFPSEHLRGLLRFYAGETQGSFARGERYQAADGEALAGSNGTLASLGGLEAALETGDAEGTEGAIKRVVLMHAVVLALDGIPLFFMGDERGLLNDYGYAEDSTRHDGRWLHRPEMPKEQPREGSPGARIFDGLRQMVAVRKAMEVFHTSGSLAYVETGNPAVLGVLRSTGAVALLCVANFSSCAQVLDKRLLRTHLRGEMTDVNPLNEGDAQNVSKLAPYQCRWLV